MLRGGVVLVALGRWLSLVGFALGFGVVVRSAALGRDDAAGCGASSRLESSS